VCHATLCRDSGRHQPQPEVTTHGPSQPSDDRKPSSPGRTRSPGCPAWPKVAPFGAWRAIRPPGGNDASHVDRGIAKAPSRSAADRRAFARSTSSGQRRWMSCVGSNPRLEPATQRRHWRFPDAESRADDDSFPSGSDTSPARHREVSIPVTPSARLQRRACHFVSIGRTLAPSELLMMNVSAGPCPGCSNNEPEPVHSPSTSTSDRSPGLWRAPGRRRNCNPDAAQSGVKSGSQRPGAARPKVQVEAPRAAFQPHAGIWRCPGFSIVDLGKRR